MKRWVLGASLLGLIALGVPHSASATTERSLVAIADAITELDVQRATELISLETEASDALSFQRARLAIYVADCDAADAITQTLVPSPAASSLAGLAQKCSRAVAGASIVEDRERGIWFRLQDDADRALVPRIAEVAAQARAAIARDLGVELPRPLRIDLVRDLFSLSSVSGLPVDAAETTGTVAVARWGRITMVSPRATQFGYPWEDTLAHEITHLGLSRATRDFAPLWLQEGVAKNEERRWRPAHVFDDQPNYDEIAVNAYIEGRDVGVDALGPSIAMLPSADAASIAFAEVTSFIRYFVEQNGRPAFQLLLADLKGIGQRDFNHALVSVTGFELRYWIDRWRETLLAAEKKEARVEAGASKAAPLPLAFGDPLELGRRVRLGALFFDGGHYAFAGEEFEAALLAASDQPALRFETARTWLAARDRVKAEAALGNQDQIDSLHGGWFALHGRFLKEKGEVLAASQAFDLASSVDPLAPEVACEGYSRPLAGTDPIALPENPVRRALCDTYLKYGHD
jgi:hypothetical protein